MTQVQLLASMWQFTPICNFSPRGSVSLFWPLWVLHAHSAYTHMKVKHALEIKNTKKFQKCFFCMVKINSGNSIRVTTAAGQ